MFWQQQGSAVIPATVASDYGNSTKYDYSPGVASVVELPFWVDLQPISMQRNVDGSRVNPTESRWRFFTPEGIDLGVRKFWRFRFPVASGLDFDVEGFNRWPSADYPSGVDHVEVRLILREG